MTPLKSLALHCGLSVADTASFLSMPASTVDAYWKGLRGTKGGRHGESSPQLNAAILKLSTLSATLDDIAATLCRAVIFRTAPRTAMPRRILLRTIEDDKEAVSIGLPCASSHRAVLARVLAKLPPEYLPLVVFRPDVEDVEVI